MDADVTSGVGLHFAVLGPLRVYQGHREQDVPLGKARALLLYLALETDRSHPRERLAALLWPDSDSRGALNNLRQVLHHLKRLGAAEGAPLLRVDRHAVRLNPASGVWSTDAAHFLSHLEAGQLRQAEPLYRGELAADLLPPGEAYADWLEQQRAFFRQRAVALLETLAEQAQASGEPLSSQRYAERLLVLEPWFEKGHRLLLRSLADQGKSAAARHHYRQLESMLRRELDAAMEAETETLMRSIEQETLARPEPPDRRAWLRPVHLGPLQRRKLVYFFNLLDPDGTGRFNWHSLQEKTVRLRDQLSHGDWLTDELWQKVFANDQFWWEQFSAFSSQPDGSLDCDDMLDFWSHWYDRVANEARHNGLPLASCLEIGASAYLDLLDHDRDGAIDVAGYAAWLRAWAPDDDDPEATFRRLDVDGDGYLDHTELLRLIKEFHFSNDPESPGNFLYGDFRNAGRGG